MHFVVSLVTLLAVVSPALSRLSARQNSFPTCAATCLAKANTGCSDTDYSCLCHDTAFLEATALCVTTACSASDAQEADADAQEMCEAVGVTLSTTGSTTAAGTAATATSKGVTTNATSTGATTTKTTAAAAASVTSTTTHSNGAAPTSNVGIFNGAVIALAIVVLF